MGEEGAYYTSQYHHGVTKRSIKAVMSVVLYYGYKQRWTGKRSVRKMTRTPRWARRRINNYKPNVIEIAYLDRAVIDRFQSDFWFLADYVWQQRNYGKYEAPARTPDNPFRVVQMLAALEKDKSILDRFVEMTVEGEKKDMSGYFTRWANEIETKGRAEGRVEGVAEGRAEGRKEGRAEGRKEGRAEGSRIADACNNRLFAFLLRDGRLEDALRSTEDPVRKAELYKEYNIETK